MTERTQRTDDKTDRAISVVRAGARRASRRLDAGADDRARELMSMAAHDLRSPLAAIKMNAYVLERRWQTGEQLTGAEWAAVVSRISRAVDSACCLVDDLL